MQTLHIISHTHWDREWYRTFQQFRLKLVHLVDGLLDLLENDKDYKHFMLDGQTIVLDDYLLMRPEKEELLHKYIQKGRLLIGPWHILPDMFLVGPESHIRNLLQGARTARRFGPKMMVGYIPDPFGHPGQTPQILRGFGIETACLWRGADVTNTEFWWQSPDGSRVLMAYLRDGYGNGAELPADNLERFAAQLTEKAESLAADSKTSDLLVMYGTDHMEPPPDTSEAIAYADEMLRNTHVIHSTLPQYVAAIQSALKKQKTELPTVTGELRACRRMHLLPGVLSARMWIKQRNHASEVLLTKWVEPFSTFARWQVSTLTGRNAETWKRANVPTCQRLENSAHIIHQTWRLLMENHPHDSICGCSVDQVHDEMKVRFDQVDQIGEELARQSLEAIAGAVNTSTNRQYPTGTMSSIVNQKSAIVIFNPTSSTRTDLVNVTLELPGGLEAFEIVDESGAPLPYQEHGLGSHEIISMTLDARGLQSAFGNISDGHAAGMSVQDVKVRREAAEVFIDAVMADESAPNLAAWNAGLKQIEAHFKDPSITTYHVRARSTSAAQIVLAAQTVPGLGYQTLWVRPRSGEGKAPLRLNPLVKALMPLARLPFIQRMATRRHYARPPYKIESDLFAVEALKNGTLTLLDKRTGQRYGGLNRFLDGGDCGDEYNYAPPATDQVAAARLKRVIVTRGPVQQTLTLELELKTPACLAPNRKSRSKETIVTRLSSRLTLTTGVPRLDIHTEVDNHARDHRLRVHFPASFATNTAHHDGHFEVVERKIGVPDFDETWIEQPRPEVPQRAFTDVSDGKQGLMVANRGLPEVEALKNEAGNAEIALTLLRGVGWLSRDDFSTRKGHAGPFLGTPGAQMPGEWEFDYSIIPHAGNWQSAYEQAYAFETPLRAVPTGLHAGSLPPAGSFVESAPEIFVISAIKETEDKRGWLVRGCNLSAEELTVTLKLWRPFKHVEQINLAEERGSKISPAKDGSLRFTAGGHEIVTIALRD